MSIMMAYQTHPHGQGAPRKIKGHLHPYPFVELEQHTTIYIMIKAITSLITMLYLS